MLFAIGIVEDRMRGEQLEAICLGAITLIVSAWIGSQAMTMRVLCDNPALLRLMGSERGQYDRFGDSRAAGQDRLF